MAVYIQRVDGTNQEWHVGEPIPKSIGRVVTRQADGDELELILDVVREPVVAIGNCNRTRFRYQDPANDGPEVEIIRRGYQDRRWQGLRLRLEQI